MVQSGQESGADGDSDYEDGYEDDSEWNESASIVLSGIKLDKETKKALKDLGGNLTTQWGNCTHLVANNVKTSEKFLCSFGNAAFVVTQEWVTDSVQAGRLLGPKGYALSDPAAENKYGFSIRRSRALAVQSKGWLFEGRKFILSGSFSEGEAHNLNEIVKFFGGTCQRLTSPPSKRALETGFAIAMLKDLSTSGWARLAQEGSVWGRDMIIRCILQQKVDPEDDLRLPRPPSPSLELY
ncbi:hypothetical protein C8R46DRAFT_1130392 [Mycena filopes]|nr:hypothetical protein C8R46DRAFT_1130392 [Mycena filopes]